MKTISTIPTLKKSLSPCSYPSKIPKDLDRAHRYRVQYDEGLDNLVVVDGVPVIDRSKLEKLLAKISKEFSRKGAPLKADNMFVPWDENTGKSKGCVCACPNIR